jgi:hypothetical protein
MFNRFIRCRISVLSLAAKIRKEPGHQVLRPANLGGSRHVSCNSSTQCCPLGKPYVSHSYRVKTSHGRMYSPTEYQSPRCTSQCIGSNYRRCRNPCNCRGNEILSCTVHHCSSLTLLQYERCNMKMFNMHLSGLRQMLNLRGGLAAVRKSSPMLANMVFW